MRKKEGVTKMERVVLNSVSIGDAPIEQFGVLPPFLDRDCKGDGDTRYHYNLI
jgi:hypothetical protein